MDLGSQIILFVCLYFLAFIYIRAFVGGFIHYTVNKSARKKRKKGQNFIEWLLYSRFRYDIPRIILILYFIIITIHPLGLILSPIIYLFDFLQQFNLIMVDFILYFDIIWFSILAIFFWKPNGPAYERWIQKGRRKK